jgi:hypothetical protein
MKSNIDKKRPINLINFFSKKEKLIFLSFLLLIVIINMILILFCLNLLINNLRLSGEDYLFIVLEKNIMSNEVISYIQQDLSYNKNVSVFNSFIDLFNKNSSRFKFFPSYFQSSPPNLFINQNNIINNTTLLKSIGYNQYFILEHLNYSLNNLLHDLCKILLEYKQSRIIQSA